MMSVRYFEKSITTATLTVSPDRLVPPPRHSTGAWYAWQARTVCTTSSSVFGTTTPIGTCRKFDASLAYIANVAVSNRTSPLTCRRS